MSSREREGPGLSAGGGSATPTSLPQLAQAPPSRAHSVCIGARQRLQAGCDSGSRSSWQKGQRESRPSPLRKLTSTARLASFTLTPRDFAPYPPKGG